MAAELDRAAEKHRKRRILIIVLVVVTVLGAVSWVLTEHPDWVTGLFKGKNKKSSSGVMYSDELRSYAFYKTDYNLDPTKDEEYMNNKIRYLWYKDGPLEVGNPFDELSLWEGYNDAVLFFVRYFQTVLAGDVDTYNSYFTEHYISENGEHLRFAPQMVYDIHVTQLSESTDGTGSTEWTFSVEYKIHRNDGTFRNDIPSDGSRSLIFTLVGDARGNVLIDSIERYRSNN